MSGPKVVRVVTREEVIAHCERALRRVDAAMAEWTRICGPAGALDAAAAAAARERRQGLERMLAQEQFLELQKQATLEIAFLQSDAQARITKAAEAASQALQQRRRLAVTARMLLEALAKSGRAVPEDLRRDLRTPSAQEEAIPRALALLTPAAAQTQTGRQRELADTLRGGAQVATLSQWLAAHPPARARDVDLKIDRHLAELTLLGADPAAFAARAEAILEEPQTRQGLLADSLLMDLAQALTQARATALARAALRQCLTELAQDDSGAAQQLTRRIEAAAATADAATATALVTEAEALTQERLRAQAAEARRRVVLEGLASLGYEVTEGMATAWVQAGQVVLRKPGRPGYGVELAGGAQSERVQVRVVAFGSTAEPRDATRDRDAETLWCSDLERLKSTVKDAGAGVDLERALAAGATPLKVIEDLNAPPVEAEVHTLSPRALPR